jgi:hypothetical protein
MSDPTQSSDMNAEREYSKLRSWYLARLRKQAIAQATTNSLTPAALVAADRKFVEQRIIEQANQHVESPQKILTFGKRMNIIWAVVSVTFALWLLILEGFDIGATASTYFSLTIGWLLGDSPDVLFKAGLPSYFILLPVISIGWPVVGWVILPLFQSSLPDKSPQSEPRKRD